MHPKDFEAIDHSQLHVASTSAAAGVDVRWLGTAGYRLTHGDAVVLIDPYLTRVGLWRFLTRPIAPDVATIDREISAADAVLVGHSHFDHVMDVPHIAKKTGAHVYGSNSTANLMAAAGVPATQVTRLTQRTTFDVGPFKITAIPSVHSTFAFGKKVPYPGDIPCSCEFPVRGKQYRCGDVFSYLIEVAGCRLYHMGSANLIDDEVPKGDLDLLMVCIAARYATPDFMSRALAATTPRIVMPMHYDNFFRSFDRSMALLPRTRFGRFVDDVSAFSQAMTVRTLPLGGRVHLTADR